jgi:hypothetical protein
MKIISRISEFVFFSNSGSSFLQIRQSHFQTSSSQGSALSCVVLGFQLQIISPTHATGGLRPTMSPRPYISEQALACMNSSVISPDAVIKGEAHSKHGIVFLGIKFSPQPDPRPQAVLQENHIPEQVIIKPFGYVHPRSTLSTLQI